MLFDHEKLDVYKISLEFNRLIDELMNAMNSKHRHIKDQLARASLSIALNIAEGNGKRTHGDRNRFFEIARGSAMECAAILDILGVIGFGQIDLIQKCKALLLRVVSMLYKMTEIRGQVREDEVEYAEKCESSGKA